MYVNSVYNEDVARYTHNQRKLANMAMNKLDVIAIVIMASKALSNPGWQAKLSF
jgi:hypothetical protein